MLILHFKNFIRSRLAVTGLAVVLGAGIVSLFIGREHLRERQNDVARVAQIQREHIRHNVKVLNGEMGLLLYYLRFGLVNQTHPLNALSIGQRDVNPSIQRVTIRNLENQKYDTDLFNPTNLQAGNLDLGFVLIYLFPLLVIAFTYNVLSEEKEGSTWKLILAQSNGAVRLLVQKFAVRAAAVFAALAGLLVLAAGLLSLPLDAEFLAAVLLSVLYVLCWFAISFWVVSWQKSSGTNAVSLLSGWLLLTVLVPGAVNSYLSHAYPVPEALATAVKQREGYHEKWDMDKGVTMDKFYAHYPQYRQYPLPDKQFSWLWYYAMQQMGDDEARQEAAALRAKLWQRENASQFIACFFPTLHAQHQMSTLAGAGLANHLRFLDHTTRVHEELRLHFYPKIFGEAPINEENWEAFRVAFFSEDRAVNWVALLLPLVSLTGLFAGMSSLNLRKLRPSD
jgi:ABC-2 type transport system permease protein